MKEETYVIRRQELRETQGEKDASDRRTFDIEHLRF